MLITYEEVTVYWMAHQESGGACLLHRRLKLDDHMYDKVAINTL